MQLQWPRVVDPHHLRCCLLLCQEEKVLKHFSSHRQLNVQPRHDMCSSHCNSGSESQGLTQLASANLPCSVLPGTKNKWPTTLMTIPTVNSLLSEYPNALDSVGRDSMRWIFNRNDNLVFNSLLQQI